MPPAPFTQDGLVLVLAAGGDHAEATDLPGATRTDHWYVISGLEVDPRGVAGAVAVLGDSLTDSRGSTTNANDGWPDQLLARLQGKAGIRDMTVLNQAAGGTRVPDDGLGPNALARLAWAVRAHAQGIRVYGRTITPFGGNTGYDDTGDHLHLDPEGHAALAAAAPTRLLHWPVPATGSGPAPRMRDGAGAASRWCGEVRRPDDGGRRPGGRHRRSGPAHRRRRRAAPRSR